MTWVNDNIFIEPGKQKKYINNCIAICQLVPDSLIRKSQGLYKTETMVTSGQYLIA